MPKSRVEAAFPELSEQYLLYIFQDKEGTQFKAKSDSELMLDTHTGKRYYIELKDCRQLNTIQTVRTSANNLKNRAERYGLSQEGNHNDLSGRIWNSIQKPCKQRSARRNQVHENAWNHSCHKQAIVQRRLEEDGIGLLIAFNEPKETLQRGKKNYQWQDFYERFYGLTDTITTATLREWIDSGRLIPADQPAKKAQPIRKASRKATRRGIFRRAT